MALAANQSDLVVHRHVTPRPFPSEAFKDPMDDRPAPDREACRLL